MKAPKARVAHAAPGRVRIRLTEVDTGGQSAESYFEKLARDLVKCPAVSAVSPRARTSSLVIMHRGDFSAIVQFARKLGLFDCEAARPLPKTILGQIRAEVSRVDDRVRDKSRGRVGLDTIGFYALLAAGGYQLLRGHFLPAAAALILNAATWVPRESTSAPAPMP
jgi:hypothetical protein